MVAAPTSEAELIQCARGLAGLKLCQIASQFNLSVPENQLRAKGFVGQLLEQALGASAKNKAEPDFEHIGVELKSIPIDGEGKPVESTYVCVAQLLSFSSMQFESSLVWKKLKRVLWVPVCSTPDTQLADRRIGNALLWSPTQSQFDILKRDWEELTELLLMGEYQTLTGRCGTYLQIRPKAANSRCLSVGLNQEGERMMTLPRGFYLRSTFTRYILAQHFSKAL